MRGVGGRAIKRAVQQYAKSYPRDYNVMLQRSRLINDADAPLSNVPFFPFTMAVLNLQLEDSGGGAHIDPQDAANVRGMCLKFGNFKKGSQAIMCLSSKTLGLLQPGDVYVTDFRQPHKVVNMPRSFDEYERSGVVPEASPDDLHHATCHGTSLSIVLTCQEEFAHTANLRGATVIAQDGTIQNPISNTAHERLLSNLDRAVRNLEERATPGQTATEPT
mmetsp:Transcript_10959/g.29398  ORF Transcript_10959/g.29398 Transcript_10959/m.29398 type:complete len:219 (-) Transcript_10959:245-901(-)